MKGIIFQYYVKNDLQKPPDGFTSDALYHWATDNGNRLGQPKNTIDENKVVEYRKQNKSIRQIANELNLSKGVVQRTLEMCL